MPATKDQDFLEFVLDQLHALPAVEHRRMFGAIGLYQGGVFFGIIDDGRLFFFTADETRARYTTRGSKPFEYAPGKRLATYYDVPVDVLEDDGELVTWARESLAARKSRPAKKRPPRRPQKRSSNA